MPNPEQYRIHATKSYASDVARTARQPERLESDGDRDSDPPYFTIPASPPPHLNCSIKSFFPIHKLCQHLVFSDCRCNLSSALAPDQIPMCVPTGTALSTPVCTEITYACGVAIDTPEYCMRTILSQPEFMARPRTAKLMVILRVLLVICV